MTDSPNIVFLDTETTSLRPDRRAWEVSLILRRAGQSDAEVSWFITATDLDLGNADPTSLKIGRFYERHPQFNGSDHRWGEVQDADVVAQEVEGLTREAILVGAVPNFDTETLAPMLRRAGFYPAWHYHLVDVETLAAGALKLSPKWDFDAVLAEYDLMYDEADRHTALGDARMVRDLYDAVLAAPSTK